MGKVTGLGGVFIKAKDPKALADWYQQYLGINFNGNVYMDFKFTDEQGKLTPGFNVLSFFKNDSTYFDPSEKQAMLNFRVSDLKGLLAELTEKGVLMAGVMQEEQFGKFGWILDLEGNKIELWEPPVV